MSIPRCKHEYHAKLEKLCSCRPVPENYLDLSEIPAACEVYEPGPDQDKRGTLNDWMFCKTCGFPFEFHSNPFGKPETCRACALYFEPGMVKGFGPESANMMFVGEAPSSDEVDFPYYRKANFKPFTGGTGRLLSSLCAHAGIDRRKVYVTNVVKCRPPLNRTPSAHEIACCATFLIEEIDRINPNVIAAMGETPLITLTDKKGIGLYRGIPTEGYAGRKIFPMWHPSFIARAQHNWPFAVHDLVRAETQSAFPEVRRLPFVIVRDASVSRDGAATLAAIRACGATAFDFETTGLSPKHDQIQMLGLTAGSDKADVYDWSDRALQFLQEIIDDDSIEVIGQNILYFDLPFAEEKGLKPSYERIFDTMVVMHLCNSSYGQTPIAQQSANTPRVRGAEKDLAMIASCYTDMEYWKGRNNYKEDLKEVCGKDVIGTHRSAIELKKELAAYDMTDLYYKHVLPVHPILSSMTKLGVKIDQQKAAMWAIGLESKANEYEGILREGLGDPTLNLDSPKQLMALLYDKLGLAEQVIIDRKRGRRRTANAEALETLATIYPEHAVVRTLVDIRHFRKMRSTYIMPALEGDGRLHPRFGVSKASTGRFNSWEPNAQNVPEDMRDIWVPDSNDDVLTSADWSQIEWRLGMVLSGDPVGLEMLASGVDNHSAIAAETLSKKIGDKKNGTCDHEDCTEHVTEKDRYSSKFIVYGLGYGRGAESISVGHGLSMDFVERFIGRFFERFKVYAKWRERNVARVKKDHYLANAFKRRRWWYTWQVTEVYNFPMQSNGADMMYRALIELGAQLPKGSTLRLTVHDEVVINTPKDIVRETIECVKTVMQRTWPNIEEMSDDPAEVRKHYPNGWYCPADIHIGTDWAMTKSKNPEKTRERNELEKHLGLIG